MRLRKIGFPNGISSVDLITAGSDEGVPPPAGPPAPPPPPLPPADQRYPNRHQQGQSQKAEER